MNPDTLLTLAEVAAAFVGFAAITTVLVNRGAVHPDDRNRFLLILSIGGLTVVNCFIPFWILESSDYTDTIWRHSLFVMLAISFPVLIWVGVLIGQIRRNEDSGTKAERYAVSLVFLVGIGLLVTSLVWSWPFESSQRVYEISQVCNLLIIATIFASLVLDRPEHRTEIEQPKRGT